MCKRFADDRCWSVGYFKPTSLFFQGKCKFEWDKLYDMFLQCDGDWMQCCLVTESTSAHGHERLGRWKSFTKQESISWNPMCCFVISCDPKSFCTRILERTSCASTKMRLQFWISSPVRTADGLWQSNPDFPNVEDPPVQYMYIYFKIL